MTTTSAAPATAATLDLVTALVRLSHLVQHVFADVSREQGLTPQQAQLLCLLIDGPVGMTELRRLLHLEKSSITGMIDRTERSGLVTRLRDPADRRTWRIALTDHGSRLASQAHNGVIVRLDSFAREILPDDKERVAALITAMLAETGLSSGRRPSAAG